MAGLRCSEHPLDTPLQESRIFLQRSLASPIPISCATLGIPLIHGLDFAESDSVATPPVALISEGFKRGHFPTEDPTGRQIHIGPPPFLQIAPGANITDSADVTIIGVMGDFKNAGSALPPEPQVTVLYSRSIHW